ncbi:MAG TPA: potassium-transporting ATPase subunit KdpA, partial [Candidatus Eisenbacteria bacterium]
MNGGLWLNLAVFMGVLLLLARPLGNVMADVYEGRTPAWLRWLGPFERGLYRLGGVRTNETMSWKRYAAAFLASQVVGLVLLFVLQLLQEVLPLNPAGLAAPPWHLALNTAISFVTNTNWQSYGGETTLSYLVQSLGLTVQNFVSAGAGMAVMVALARGFSRRKSGEIGNYWVDLTRGVVFILLPLAIVVSVVLVAQGVVQTWGPYLATQPIDGHAQLIARGPAAAQVAIKQLGTNGGGFFNVNSAHPLENPTPLTNLVEMFSILLIPVALAHTWGRLIGSTRQGWALLLAMTILFVPCAVGVMVAEQS